MTTEIYGHSPTNLDLFREKVAAARRQTGQLQRELASALGIDAHVLSRKLHGMKQAFPRVSTSYQCIQGGFATFCSTLSIACAIYLTYWA